MVTEVILLPQGLKTEPYAPRKESALDKNAVLITEQYVTA
jgi:hypothetical protein